MESSDHVAETETPPPSTLAPAAPAQVIGGASSSSSVRAADASTDQESSDVIVFGANFSRGGNSSRGASQTSGEDIADTRVPRIPNWVAKLASDCQREQEGDVQAAPAPVDAPTALLWPFMTKRLTRSDLDVNENRLLISAMYVKYNVIAFLTDEEKIAASLDVYPKRRIRYAPSTRRPPPKVDVEDLLRLTLGPPSAPPPKLRKAMELGRQHGGLPVIAWAMNKKRFDSLRLTCWDRSNGTVLKGKDLKRWYAGSAVDKEDEVELWAFRAGGRLHLALHKSTETSAGLQLT